MSDLLMSAEALYLEGSRRDWQNRGSCRGMDPDLFFPATDDDTERAKAICFACDVRLECLAFAQREEEKYGVWGGTSEKDRAFTRFGLARRYRVRA